MARLPPSVALLIDEAAERYGVPRELARALAWVESGGDADAVSSAGAVGVMQLMASTAQSLGVDDRFDAAQNVDAGVRLFAQLVQQYGERIGIAAYNLGQPKLAATPESEWSPKLRKYVADVFARRDVERGIQPLRAYDFPRRRGSTAAAALAFVAAISTMALTFRLFGGRRLTLSTFSGRRLRL